MTEYLNNIWDILLRLSPWLLFGSLMAGMLHVWLPSNFIKRHLGKPGLGSILKAALIGVPMPLCSCSVIPTGIGLKKDGAGTGASVSFIISTPQTGVDSIAVTAAFLGWPFAFFKMMAAMITGVVGGLLSETRITPAEESSAPAQPASCCSNNTTPSAPTTPVWQRIWQFGFDDLLYMIWRWLVIGILVSAAISTYVGHENLHIDSTGGQLLAMGAALVISIPLYVCATSCVPIAAALVSAGLPTGAALVFLMAGPATNMATIGAVARGLGRRALFAYLGTVIIGSTVLGLTYDWLIGLIPNAPTHAMGHDHHSGVIAYGCTAFLLGLILWFAIRDIKKLLQPKPSGSSCCSK